MIKKYKKLLFDLDNTLIDDDENRKYALEKILNQRKEQVTNEKLESFIESDNQFWKDRAEGKIKDQYKFKINEEKTTWVMAQRFVKYLYDKKYELHIITNSPTKVVIDKLTKINAQGFIKDTFSAEEAGHMKPNREFFYGFFSKINNYKKEEMLIIGDELEKDILGGI